MKFIQNFFLIGSLLALNAAAQTASNPPPRTGPPGSRMPPGLLNAPHGPTTPPKMPDKDKLSYALGMNIGSSIKREKIDVDLDTLIKAMREAATGESTKMTEAEVHETIVQFQQAMAYKRQAERQKEMEENKAKGEEFLAKNAKAPDVKSLPNGLQYKVLKEGTGPMPAPANTVTVSYEGRLIDGTIFDQNSNFTTRVTGRTIRGWSEVLPLMKVGAKWEVTIPADLAYGTRGAPPKIGPDAVLVFDMELLSVTPAPPAPAPTPAPKPASTSGGPPAPPSGTSGQPVVSGQIIKVPSAEEMKKGAKIEVITNVPPQ